MPSRSTPIPTSRTTSSSVSSDGPGSQSSPSAGMQYVRRRLHRSVTDNWVMIEGIAVWRDELTPAERAQLGREPGVIPEPRPDVLVVGGGIVGVATAAACHEAGLGSVLVIEAGRLGSGATGGAAGL